MGKLYYDPSRWNRAINEQKLPGEFEDTATLLRAYGKLRLDIREGRYYWNDSEPIVMVVMLEVEGKVKHHTYVRQEAKWVRGTPEPWQLVYLSRPGNRTWYLPGEKRLP